MNCKNCKTLLEDSSKFCNECGAKVINHRITLGYLWGEAKEGLFSLDSSKPIRTFIDMFTKPEVVIDGYVNGVRKRHINAFGYFTIALTFSSFFFFVFLKWFPNLLDYSVQSVNYSDAYSKEQLELQSNFTKTMFEYSSLVFFLTIPLMSLVSRIVFWKNKKYNYAEHLIINLYTYSHLSLVSTFLYFLTIWSQSLFTIVSFSVLFVQIIFYCYVLKRLYGLDLGEILLKLLIFLLIFGVIAFLLIIVGIIIGFTSGSFDGIIEEAKKQKALKATSYITSSLRNWTS